MKAAYAPFRWRARSVSRRAIVSIRACAVPSAGMTLSGMRSAQCSIFLTT